MHLVVVHLSNTSFNLPDLAEAMTAGKDFMRHLSTLHASCSGMKVCTCTDKQYAIQSVKYYSVLDCSRQALCKDKFEHVIVIKH